jgi:hypothetical protein
VAEIESEWTASDRALKTTGGPARVFLGTRQNEGNHNSQKATLRRAGCPGGSSSITRPIKPRTHPGLEKRETWGTHSYLILLPKIKDGSGQETRATRQQG